MSYLTILIFVWLFLSICLIIFSKNTCCDEGTTNKWNADPIQVPVGSVTSALAKKFKETLNGLIQKIWVEVNLWRPKKMLYMFHKVGFPWFKLWNNLEESIKENMSQIAWIEWSFLNWWLPNFWLIKEIGWCNLKQSFKIAKLPFLFIIIF